MDQKKRYHPAQIEKKWQEHWEKNKTFKVTEDAHRPKYYILDMFPYPSGAGLHVGHVEGYTATDIVARHKRQLGFNVLHPMGWDSFGLPAEQYALRTGTHPAITTQKNIETYRRQLKSLGFSYDWDREFATSDPTYYKWTQWIFTKLYEKGLAYEANILVNYCPALGTVLANEEIIDGKSEIGGHPVERRPLKQWVLKITAYAEKLLEDLELVDWPDHLKRLQRNWIGKSEGVEVTFKANDVEILVFTTRADTLFGATYIVLSPEHPLASVLTAPNEKAVVESYCQEALKKSDMDRTDLTKEKTGIFTGSYATNPVNGEKIPIWIGDYVLMGYGTGAIMAVPAHDQRDFDFAEKYGLNISAVYDPDLAAHPELIPEGRSAEEIRSSVLAGSFCWSGEGKAINSSHGDLSINGLNIEEAQKTTADWLEAHRHGRRAVNYKLRDWLFSRQRYWGEPFPILHFEDGSKRVLGLDELPLTPPEVEDYKPAGDGRSPLAKQRHWVEIVDPKTGKKALRETNTMPQWAGSCWYYLRFCDPHNTERAWDPEKEKYWMSVDLYVGGVEHAVLHLLYARFWHKVLFDCGLVSTSEPFQTLRNPGVITARAFRTVEGSYVSPQEVVLDNGNYLHATTGKPLTSQIEKMSKSKQNGVNPDEIIEEYGADAIRLYEMFMGPLEKEKVWNTDAVNGCRRFLNRFYDTITSEKVSDEISEEALRLGHRLIDNVKKDFASLQFNTAIAKHMEFLNDFTKLPVYPRQVLLMATQALMPLAPHLGEEAWEILGGQGQLFSAPYPVVDEKYLYDATITYVVQVNGKVRARLELPQDQDQGTIVALAEGNETVSRQLEGVDVVKVVFVPNKLLNFVTTEKAL